MCITLSLFFYRHESRHGSVNYEQENHQSVSETYCEVEVMSEFIGLANRKGENIFIKSMKWIKIPRALHNKARFC
jgi:hypothetical protein